MNKYTEEFKRELVKQVIINGMNVPLDEIVKRTGISKDQITQWETLLRPTIEKEILISKTTFKDNVPKGKKVKPLEKTASIGNVKILVSDSKGNKEYLSKTYKLQLSAKEDEGKVFKYSKTVNKYVQLLSKIHPTKTVVAVSV